MFSAAFVCQFVCLHDSSFRTIQHRMMKLGSCVHCTKPPFPQLDIIGAVVIVWKARGKIIRSVLCSIVCNDCTQ